MHVVDPMTFPLDKSAQYKPAPHTIDQATTFLNALNIEKMVIVQPSIYGNDNACTLDGLRRLGSNHGRAVVQFDPAMTTTATLDEWHALGVRGVRLNFKSVGVVPTAAELEATMRQYADAVRAYGWVLELYIAMEDVPLLESFVDSLDVKICIDHFAHPSAEALSQANAAHDLTGFAALLRLLERGNTWVKVSASYRLQEDANHPLVESLCREIVRARPDRCVFATDWPHTRYDGLDVTDYLHKVMDWCEDEGVSLDQIMVKNAEILFDAEF